MTLLAKVIHGSRLYGLHGPNSDTDYKGIFLPSVEDCLLNERSFNVDKQPDANEELEFFSLQKFLKLASNGESLIMDMLHCSDHHIVESNTDIFNELRKNKDKFYTKKMVGSVGYAKNMAFKYGFRADRMNALRKVLEFLTKAQELGVEKLYQCWDDLPVGEHIEKGVDERNNNIDKRFYEVSGKKMQATISVSYAIEIIVSAINRFGDRVANAAKMNGADYKAISHSFRVAFQLFHIYKSGGFKYPLPETDFLRDVKFGKLDFLNDKLDTRLDLIVTEVEQLAINSSYPERVDPAWSRELILKSYNLW